MNPFIEITRPVIWSLAGLFVIIGSLVSGGAYSAELYVAVASVILITAGGIVANDYLDRKSDNINKKHRPIPSGRISPTSAIYFAVGLLILGFIAATFVSTLLLTVTFFNILFILMYSTHFRYYHVLGNFMSSYLLSTGFIVGGIVSGNLMPALFLSIFVIFTNTAREILVDVKNLRSDRAFGLRTIPVLYGVAQARMSSSLFILAGFATLPLAFFYGVTGESFMAVALGSMAIFIYSIYQNIKDVQSETVGNEILWAMIIGIAAFVAGALI